MSAPLKSLQTRRKAARAELNEVVNKMQVAQGTYIERKRVVQELMAQVTALPENDPALESLQARLATAKDDCSQAWSDLQVVKASRVMAQQKVVDIGKRIESLTVREVVVSEHAMLRYCERVYGFNLDEIKAAILTPSVAASIKTFGDGKFPSGTGFTVVVKNRVVVSLME